MNELPKELLKKLESGREYRRIQIQNLETRAEENGEMIVEGYATTFNERYMIYDMGDYKVYEQIDPRAFDECDMSDVIMQYDHNGRVFARNKNNTLILTVDGHGLKVRANLGGTEIGRQLYEEIKGGYTDKMSFGFRVVEDRREIVENVEENTAIVTRTITKICKVYDVSAVSLPANDATEISARNFGEGVIEEIRQEMQKAEKIKRQKQKIKILLEV